MSLYTERWTARPAWLALSIPERIAYLDEMEAGMRVLTEDGARLLGVVLNEVPRIRCQYVAVWAMPNGAALGRRLEAVLEDAGWHRYFFRMDEGGDGRSLFPGASRTAMPSTHVTPNGRHG